MPIKTIKDPKSELTAARTAAAFSSKEVIICFNDTYLDVLGDSQPVNYSIQITIDLVI